MYNRFDTILAVYRLERCNNIVFYKNPVLAEARGKPSQPAYGNSRVKDSSEVQQLTFPPQFSSIQLPAARPPLSVLSPASLLAPCK